MILSMCAMIMGLISVYFLADSTNTSIPEIIRDYYLLSSVIPLLTAVRIFPREVSTIFMILGIAYCAGDTGFHPDKLRRMLEVGDLTSPVLRMVICVGSILFCSVTGPSIKECFVNLMIISFTSCIILVICSYYDIYDIKGLLSHFSSIEMESLMDRMSSYIDSISSWISRNVNSQKL